MTTSRTLSQRPFLTPASRRRQGGIVLFVALIALVILSLAGIGFMRSVDTASLLAGNMAFNRAAVAASDGGMEEARIQLATLDNTTVTGKCALTDAKASCLWMNASNMVVAGSQDHRPLFGGVAQSPPSNGYFAWADPSFNYRTFDWTNTYQFNAAVASWTATQAAALVGYDVRYVIHRMCEFPWSSAVAAQTGEPRISNCLTTGSAGGQSQGSIDKSKPPPPPPPAVPLYRVTIRVSGPRNSVAYVQVWTG
jgi:type IV pilus assembly protein PilX